MSFVAIPQSPPRLIDIQLVVAEQFGIPLVAMRQGPERRRRLTRPRQVAMYLCRHMTNRSYREIGWQFKLHHATIIHGVKSIDRNLASDPELAAMVDTLRNNIKTNRRRW